MSLRIINAGPDPEKIGGRIRDAIETAIPGAAVEVISGSPGHYEIRVRSDAFAGRTKVQQHQLVYGAITSLMSGPEAPVHAVDRLDCQLP